MSDIYEELSAVMESGDEQTVRDFIVKNIDRFPKEEQDGIVARLFEEALIAKTTATVAVADFQKEALATAAVIERTKEKLEDREKLAGIKESL